MEIKIFKKLKLPDSPGVYFFLKGKEILYIGKATSLKDRVKSYFSKDLIESRGPVILDMIFKSNNIKHQKTDSVLEALILEANLIKKYQPKYNTKEKSDKSFNYVCITKEFLPKVVVLRGSNLKNQKLNFHRSSLLGVPSGSHTSENLASDFSNLFGPYTSGSQLKEALKIVRKIFPFLDDKSKNYLEFYKQINLVPDLGDRRLYLQNIRNIKLFFAGKKMQILKNLKKEMILYAQNKEFEKASEFKRQIFALQHINDVALIKNSFTGNKIFDPAPFFGRIKGNKAGPSDTKILLPASQFRIEAYDVAHMGGKNMVGVMVVVENGERELSEYKKFKIKTQKNSNDTGALQEILERRFGHPEWQFPDLVVVDGGVAQMNAAKKIISKLNFAMDVVSVVKNEKHKPKAILGNEQIVKKYKSQILLANSEAHRFAISYHKQMRNKNFLI
jgi:excinuclease ABC subunit C